MFTINMFKQNTFPVDVLNLCSFIEYMIKATKCWDFKVLLQIALLHYLFVTGLVTCKLMIDVMM